MQLSLMMYVMVDLLANALEEHQSWPKTLAWDSVNPPPISERIVY
jgi:hypothetical protein